MTEWLQRILGGAYTEDIDNKIAAAPPARRRNGYFCKAAGSLSAKRPYTVLYIQIPNQVAAADGSMLAVRVYNVIGKAAADGDLCLTRFGIDVFGIEQQMCGGAAAVAHPQNKALFAHLPDLGGADGDKCVGGVGRAILRGVKTLMQ